MFRYLNLACSSLGPRGDEKNVCRDTWAVFCELQGDSSQITKIPMFEGHESSFLNERNIVTLFHKTIVHQFYLRDDVSRMCHGKKDYLSIKDPDTGKREHKQKH